MQLSPRGLDLIKKYEGCRLKAYKPVQAEKYWTIGWGHYGADVKEGQIITQAEADELLIKDMARYENAVNINCSYLNLNQNEFDALVSFCYNCGSGALQKVCGYGKYERNKILANMAGYVNGADGKKLAGLVRRRAEEKELFKEVKMFEEGEEIQALDYLVEKKRIYEKEVQLQAINIVKNYKYAIVKWANDVKTLEKNNLL